MPLQVVLESKQVIYGQLGWRTFVQFCFFDASPGSTYGEIMRKRQWKFMVYYSNFYAHLFFFFKATCLS